MIFHIYINGSETGLYVEGNDRKQSCGCLMNADMIYDEAYDLLDQEGFIPENHLSVMRGHQPCLVSQNDPRNACMYCAHVKVIPGESVGFVWVETCFFEDNDLIYDDD